MPSVFSWLDYSEHDRQEAIKVINLFRERDTRDELGIGTVRDALSDLLFPGTTTIQTRPRYFLLVPWVFQTVEEWGSWKHPSLDQLRREARSREIQLLRELMKADDTNGVIGREAGESLQRLPSSIYWQGLKVWGIRKFPGSQSQLHRVLQHGRAGRLLVEVEGDDQQVDGRGYWHTGLPPRPKYFPADQSLALTREEALYLQDRIRSQVGDSLLAWLVDNAVPATDVDAPWLHPQVTEIPDELARQLNHARRFAELMRGAALLYNLMLAREVPERGLEDEYEERFTGWSDELLADTAGFGGWNRDEFWSMVLDINPRITPTARGFVDTWCDLALSSAGPASLRSSRAAFDLIRDREWRLKGQRARLHDSRALERWSGSAGTGLITYRWQIVHDIVHDIRVALDQKVKRARSA
jgi:hypothetical protein